MINFELYSGKEGLDIILDSSGIDELIEYLNYIRKHNDHFFLVMGNELNERNVMHVDNTIKFVNLIYSEYLQLKS